MNAKGRIRKGISSNVADQYIPLVEATKQMRVGYRQAKRIGVNLGKKAIVI